MKKQYAFILMGSHYDTSSHQCKIETEENIIHFRTVCSFTEAKGLVVELQKQGIGAIELCGAFGPDRAKKLAELTNNEVAIGYSVNDPALDHLFTKFFDDK